MKKILSTSVVVFIFISCASSSDWMLLDLVSSNTTQGRDSIKKFCEKPDLPRRHQEFCENGTNILQVIGKGVEMAIEECQYQFRMSRWSCSPSTGNTTNTIFGGALATQSREKAYLYAISSAGVTYAMTKACALGHLPQFCGCDDRIKQRDTKGKWEWGGCSEDVRFGSQFTEDFADVEEDENTPSGMANAHNYEAGRRVIRSSMDLLCKCHGVSGACTIRVCWRKMKPFRSIADSLTRKFDAATHVKVIEGRNRIKMRPTRRDVKKPGRKDLIYLDDSPDFCAKNETAGVMGTTGRACNATSHGMDGCRILCCGRGYKTIVKTIEEKCNCKFVWCCNVKCEMCVKKIEMTTCN